MPHCPECRMEFNEGIVTCSDCGGELTLVPMLPLGTSSPSGDEKWSVVAAVGRPEDAAIMRGRLESEGVPCEILDRTVSEFPLPAAVGNSTLEILVPDSRVEEAHSILDEPDEGAKPCPSCGHLSAAEEPSCEYCGAAAS